MDKTINYEEIKGFKEWLYKTLGMKLNGIFTQCIGESLRMATLQKWFREVKELNVTAECNASGWFWNVDKTNGTHVSWSDFKVDNDSGCWETHDEALKDALITNL